MTSTTLEDDGKHYTVLKGNFVPEIEFVKFVVRCVEMQMQLDRDVLFPVSHQPACVTAWHQSVDDIGSHAKRAESQISPYF
jgi:hypothetical protein